MTVLTTIVATAPVSPRHDIPLADALLIIAVGGSGVAAAAVGDPRLWVATPMIAMMLVLVLRRAPAHARPADELADLPAALQRMVRTTLTELPEGDAVCKLQEVLRPARALFSSREHAFTAHDDDVTRTHIAELVEDSCAIALELSRIDAMALRGASADLTVRFQVARALFDSRLGEASLALAALFAAGVEHGTPASDRVAELVTVLRDEASIRREAKAELDALLAPGGGATRP